MSSYAKRSYKVHPHYLQPGRYIEEEEDLENMDPSSQHNGSAGQSSSSSMLLHDSTSSSSTSFLSESSLTEKDEDGQLQPMELAEECIIQSGSGEFEDEKEPITKSPRKLLRASSGWKKATITPKKAQSKLSGWFPLFYGNKIKFTKDYNKILPFLYVYCCIRHILSFDFTTQVNVKLVINLTSFIIVQILFKLLPIA